MIKNIELLTDDELVKKVKEEKCNESLKEIIRRHSALFNKIYQRHLPMLAAKGVDIQDVYNDRDFIIYDAIMKFNPEKSKIITWIGVYTRYYCLSLVNKANNAIPIDIMKETAEQFKENFSSDYLFDILEGMRDKRIKKVFSLRYFSKTNKGSWKEIASELGVSNQTVLNLHKRGINFLKKKLSSKNIYDFV